MCEIGFDPGRTHRAKDTIRIADVMIVGQALGSRTQRKSGVPYTFPGGVLSRTGKVLEEFLELSGLSFNKVYCTDAVKCYPGRKLGGDRHPNKGELDNCSYWLLYELLIVRPKVLVLLGRVAEKAFRRITLTDLETPSMILSIPHPSYFRRKPEQVRREYAVAAYKIKEKLL